MELLKSLGENHCQVKSDFHMGPVPTCDRDTAMINPLHCLWKAFYKCPLGNSGLFHLFHGNVADPQNQI